MSGPPELGGRAPDPDCVHCVLAAPLQAFIDAHPDRPAPHIFYELLQLAADYVASTCTEDGQEQMLKTGPHQLQVHLAASFAGAKGYTGKRRLEAGLNQQDAYRDLKDAPPGDVADLPESPAYRRAQEQKMQETHHAPGSAEERYSRQMRFDKYLAMQKLLMKIGSIGTPPDARPFLDEVQKDAAAILAGMRRPIGPAARAKDRAQELEMLVLAYHLASGVFPVESPHLPQARQLIIEALKAWERAHPPEPIDPLLLIRP